MSRVRRRNREPYSGNRRYIDRRIGASAADAQISVFDKINTGLIGCVHTIPHRLAPDRKRAAQIAGGLGRTSQHSALRIAQWHEAARPSGHAIFRQAAGCFVAGRHQPRADATSRPRTPRCCRISATPDAPTGDAADRAAADFDPVSLHGMFRRMSPVARLQRPWTRCFAGSGRESDTASKTSLPQTVLAQPPLHAVHHCTPAAASVAGCNAFRYRSRNNATRLT